MKKIKLLLITAFAIVGALLIYNHFENIKTEEVEQNKFSTEYKLVDSDNIYVYRTIDEIIDILSNKTGVVFLCTHTSEWCQYYALYLNDGLKKLGVEEINYLNITDYRTLNTAKYQKIVELLENYLYVDDTNNKKIYMPDLTFVKNGKIIAHNNETSLVSSETNIEEYWTLNKINEFSNKLNSYVTILNQEETEEEVNENIE